MSKRFIRLFCMVVMATMLFTLIACSQTEEQTPEDTTKAAATTAKTTTKDSTTKAKTTKAKTTKGATTKKVVENPFAEFYEISWLTGFCDTYEEGAWDERMLEEKYNVDFKVWNISYYDREGLSMMLAAGDIPDFCYIPKAPTNPVELYEGGFTRSIPLDMYKEYFPYYYDMMEKNAPSSFKYNNIPGTDEYYGISYIMSTYKNYYNGPVFRLDWLRNIGYDIPEDQLTPMVLTDEKLGKYSGLCYITNFMFEFEEMNDIFRAFTEDDPDGNGEDDTYAAVIWPPSFRSHWVDLYWGMFGVIASDSSFLYKEKSTGDVVPWYAYSGYRDYLQWSTEIHDKGYMRTLPKDGEGSWYDILLATWMTGKVGYFSADRQYIARPDFPEYADRQPPQSLWLNGEETATFVCMPVLKGPGPEGSWGTRRYGLDAFDDGPWRTWNVAKDVSDGKLARILTMWNDKYTNPKSDFNSKVFMGIEGVHYKWSGEPWESAIIRTPKDKIPEKYRRGGWWGGSFSAELPVYSREGFRQLLLFHIEYKWAEKYCIEPYKYMNIMNMGNDMLEAYNDDWEEVGESINAAISDFRNRAWNGEISDISTEWEQYINQLYAAGLEELIEKYFSNDEFPTYEPPFLGE